jgi:type I restriction-modification system DNA methylase subunit
MSLFQPIIIKNYLKTLNQDEVNSAWDKFQRQFQDPAVQANIKQNKEEQYQEGFLRDLFVNVFGYVLNPKHGFNLTTELKNLKGSKKCDGAILKDNKALAVIELKGMNTTDLASIESQAFGYKNNHPTCRYVVTSNFQKLRFYIDNAVEFIEFDLFKISQDDFSFLYLLLKANNLLADIPLKIKSESISQEEKVTKQLYKDYSTFKRALFDDLVKNNSQYDPLTLFQKSQKLLDRLLFIFFAEDSGLLAANTARTMLKEWEKLKALKMPISVYDQLKRYFGFLDTGYKDDTSEIFAYNGGLFKSDEILDNVNISDTILSANIAKLADYDFASEVDVNILGHIFENSLTEIDEIKAELYGKPLDKTQSKRKKDGVFYTPKYITNYIVQNTVGKLCADKKAEIGIVDEDYITDKKRQKKTQETLLQRLKDYRAWLLEITICDPACGSGAFLNEALNFLMAEHAYLDELESKLFGGGLVFQEVRNHILENNLFGVDINQESVEIAKLSLWLRTAEPHRKLSNLNENLKCGNSLIDDARVAGEKAFNWGKAFPKVFEKGGFDVVIGNPPYVRIQGLQDAYPEMVSFYNQTYQSATGNYDIYALFMEKSLELINKNGVVSFILPHKFLVTDFGSGIRKFFVEKRCVQSIVHFGSELVFADASTYTCIIDLNLKSKEKIYFKKIHPLEISQYFEWDKMDYDLLTENNWDLQPENIYQIIEKLKTQPYTIEDVFEKIFQGIATSLDEIYVFAGEKHGSLIKGFNEKKEYHFEIESEIVRPIVGGKEVIKYDNTQIKNYVLFPYYLENGKALAYSENDIKIKYPKAYDYIKKFEKELRGREKNRMNIDDYWMSYIYPKNLDKFDSPKIMTREISLGCNMTYDEKGEIYHNTKVYSFVKNPKFKIGDKFYLSILNSKLMWFFLKNTGSEYSGGFYVFKTNYLKPFPLPEIPDNAQSFIDKADEMLSLNKELQDINGKLLRTLERKFDLTDPSKNLQNWQNLTYKEFIKELGKKKIKLALADEAEWEDYFLAEQAQAQALQTKIAQTDKEIDNMVYQLYGLTDDEIKIIENT